MENLSKQEMLKRQIISLMGEGIENIKTGDYFTKTLNISRRMFTDTLESVRLEIPVISRKTKPCGYYIATNKKEIMDYINELFLEVDGYYTTIKIMENHYCKMDSYGGNNVF